jgi:hypothetical protein
MWDLTATALAQAILRGSASGMEVRLWLRIGPREVHAECPVTDFKRTSAATPEIQLQHLLLAHGLVAQPALLPFRRSSVNVGAGLRTEPKCYRR